MSPTVHELRNEIRVAVGRYERVESTAFTKEALAAICVAVGEDIAGKPLPPKDRMRGTIRQRVAGLDDTIESNKPLRKAELETLAAVLTGDD